MSNTHHTALKAALEWYVDHGVDEALTDEAQNRFKAAEIPPPAQAKESAFFAAAMTEQNAASGAANNDIQAPVLLGQSEARAQAIEMAGAARTLDELKQAIQDFDGLAIKKTATNMVFADGNPEAAVMLVGEAPGADEDRQGLPFVGLSGRLLDRMLYHIGVNRHDEDPVKAIYISNILNWRPPGNRTPSPAEIAISLPFIERHIALVRPKILILCGGVAAKALLGRDESISRLRKTWHQYTPQHDSGAAQDISIEALATYHPAYLLRTPVQKKAAWVDMLMMQQKRRDMSLN